MPYTIVDGICSVCEPEETGKPCTDTIEVILKADRHDILDVKCRSCGQRDVRVRGHMAVD